VYNIYAAFEITPTGGSAEKVILSRNPWGRTSYNQAWQKTDANWNADTKAQAALAYPGFDPTPSYDLGYFVMPMTKLLNGECYADYQIAHLRNGYSDTWYDANNMNEEMHKYSITVPAKDGDLYFTVESYPINSVPPTCTSGTFTYNSANGQVTSNAEQPLAYFALYNVNDLSTPIEYKYYVEQF
jgi:hypothetical protein